MKRISMIVALSLAVAACHLNDSYPTDTPPIKAAGKEAAVLRDGCRKRHEAGELTLTQSVQCSNSRTLAAFDEAGYPYMDLLRLGAAARQVGAEKVDRGELTEDQYYRELGELRSRVAYEIDRRNAEAAKSKRSEPPSPASQTTAIDPATKAKLLEGLGAFSSLMP